MNDSVGLNDMNRAERLRRWREFYIILAIIPLVIIITYIESYVASAKSGAPVSTNIVVYGLININIILLVSLVFLILRNAAKLLLETRKKVIGSKLKTKLIAAFVAITIIPAFLLFFIAIGFINLSIDSWFNIKVEDALEESLSIARNYYEDASSRMLNGAWRISNQLQEGSRPGTYLKGGSGGDALRGFLASKLDEGDFSTIEVYSLNADRLGFAMSGSVNRNMVPDIGRDEVRRAIKQGAKSLVQTFPSGDVVRGIAPIKAADGETLGAVVVSYYIPRSLVVKMGEITASFEGYKQLKIFKNPVKTGYITILSIITLVIVFFSIWIGQYMAKAITVPIFELAEGTHAVATGNLDYRINVKSNDEIGQLVTSFNRMTEDLKAGKSQIEDTNIALRAINAELDSRRGYIEIVLGNIHAGVMSIDRSGVITSLNKVASEMLSIKEANAINRNYKEALRPAEGEFLQTMIGEMLSTGRESLERQTSIGLKDRAITVLFNLTVLRDETRNHIGVVAVLDDLTHLLKTQRMAAWKEVAKRIAHEIKNPLTPIQLSAQRLRKKYSRILTEGGEVFDECTKTIIKEVDELKGLVNEFSNFARLPAVNPAPNDLNAIVDETVAIYKGAHKNISFAAEPDPNLPIIEVDREQIKRALVNLIDNAVHSIENEGEIKVKTFYDVEFNLVRLEITDTGCGIAADALERLFEPYFSTKKSGTGLGLAIVNDIISDHNGYIRVKDNVPKGTKFIVELPLKVGL